MTNKRRENPKPPYASSFLSANVQSATAKLTQQIKQKSIIDNAHIDALMSLHKCECKSCPNHDKNGQYFSADGIHLKMNNVHLWLWNMVINDDEATLDSLRLITSCTRRQAIRLTCLHILQCLECSTKPLLPLFRTQIRWQGAQTPQTSPFRPHRLKRLIQWKECIPTLTGLAGRVHRKR